MEDNPYLVMIIHIIITKYIFMTQNLQTISDQNDLQRLTNKSFSQLIEEFLSTRKSTQTQRAYKKDISTFFDAIWLKTVGELATLPVYELSKLIINYIESFKKTEEHREDRIHNPRTLNRKAYALSSFFEYLVANYGYPRNPVKVYTPYSTPDKTSTQDLEKKEVEDIWQRAKQQHTLAESDFKKLSSFQQLLIIGFLMLSLRRNEIVHLRWDDRDRKKNFFMVYGKGQKYKYLPLNQAMKDYLEEFESNKKIHGYISPYVFSPLRNNSTWNTSKPITGTYVFNLVKKIVKTLKLDWKIDLEKKITPHSFRTTFVKIALDSGKTDIEIMNTTWHSTSAMVKYYDSRSPLDVNAASVVDDLLT